MSILNVEGIEFTIEFIKTRSIMATNSEMNIKYINDWMPNIEQIQNQPFDWFNRDYQDITSIEIAGAGFKKHEDGITNLDFTQLYVEIDVNIRGKWHREGVFLVSSHVYNDEFMAFTVERLMCINIRLRVLTNRYKKFRSFALSAS